MTRVHFEHHKARGVEYARQDGHSTLFRSESTSFHRSTNEGVKHHTPFNKWNREQMVASIQRLGAPVDQSLALDYNRPHSQYVPLNKTEYKPQLITARHEVILSAGAIGTAHLLMLSGIGPAEHLRERSIPVRVDLPVGKHTQDHQVLYFLPKLVLS